MKLPELKLSIPKPKPWDLVAAGALAAGLAVAGWSLAQATQDTAGNALSTAVTWALITVQLTVCVGSLLVLGKTAKEGTIWGNLSAVGGMMIGLGGVMLAAGLWAAG